MTETARTWLSLLAVLLAAGVVFLLGITWGLPSGAVDPYLFGDEPVWPGQKIAALAPSDAGVLGADVDANPLAARDRPVIVNATDAQRAEIIRRYRLFSYQPDEMITFKSLAQIKTHRGDPRLYQYGGLWIYPVGVMLAVADVVGFIDLRGGPDGQAYYLDHPEAFGRFYVVARLYAALWGLIAVAAVFWIVRRSAGSNLVAAAGALAFAFMPVVITMAHEAKPHLPGLALTLLAAVAATKFVETGRTRFVILAGICCGAAFGMVLSALLSFAILPAMALLRRGPSSQQRLVTLAQATAVGLLVYAITNPFVAINAIRNPAILSANLGNSTAMYAPSLGGARNAFGLMVMGASPVVLAGGVIGVLVLARYRRRRDRALWLLAAPAAMVAVQFALLARGKPPEYARFALVPDAFLLIACFAALARVPRELAARIAACGVAAATFVFGLPYLLAFMHDASPVTSRLLAGRLLSELHKVDAQTMRLTAEPAPYGAPPIDLFRYRILYAPPDVKADADVTVTLDPAHMLAPICWADARFAVEVRSAAAKTE